MTYPNIDLDNGFVQDTDYVLSGESPLIIAKINEMPVLDSTWYAWNQYVHKRHNDSCTKFRGYNARCTMFNHRGSREEIDKIEAKSLEMGWLGLGHGWSSSQGGDAVRKVMNELYPNRMVSKRYYDFDSDAHELLKEKHRPMNVSIVVDSEYWKQTKTGKITGTSFKKNYGHADCIVQWDGTMYKMIESVGGITYDIEESVFDTLVKNGNIRSYGYVLLPIDVKTLPENSIRTMAERKKIFKERAEQRKLTHDRYILKGPIKKTLQRVDKKAERRVVDGKTQVLHNNKWYEIVI